MRGRWKIIATDLNKLADNAINYTSSEGRLSVRRRIDGCRAVIEVEDTGIGIPKQHQARVLERFDRMHKARSRELGGTGLSLSIVKNWVQVFGGTVEVSSELVRGSKFAVRLPAVSGLSG